MEKETIGQWTTELRTSEANCEFQESDNMIKDNIVIGIRDRPVQEKLLREYDLTLEKALDICRASETSKDQYQAMSPLHQQDIAVYDIRAGEREVRNKVIIRRVVSKDNVNTVATPIHHGNVLRTRNVICVAV